LSAFFTAFYSIRLFYLTFLNTPNGPKASIEQAHESPILMALPLMILAIASIFIGYISRDAFIGLGTEFFQSSIVMIPEHLLYVNSEFIPTEIKLLPLVFTLSGASLAFILYYAPQYKITIRPLFTFLSQK